PSSLPSAPPPRSAPPDEDTVAVRRAVSLLDQGLVSRASRSLGLRGLPPLTPPIIDELRSLHPPASEAPPPLPAHAPRVHVDPQTLRRIVVSRRISNGAAPGPSGWTGELFRALIDDPDCLLGLSSLVEDIVNGNLT